jgi:hypothetical protein
MNSMTGARSLFCYIWVALTMCGLLALVPSPAQGATYYVDANNPSARSTNPGTEA